MVRTDIINLRISETLRDVLKVLSQYYDRSMGDVAWLIFKYYGKDFVTKVVPLKFDEEKLEKAKEALKKL